MDEDLLLKDVPPEMPYEEVEDDEGVTYDSDAESNSDTPRWKKIISKLSPHLRGLMGEANLRYARGEIELAKKMCFEVIRQIPDAYEPYLTLAQIFENHNIKKYKGFLMLAAHLCPSNVEIWCRLADIEVQDSQIVQAVRCYNRAIRVAPRDIDLHMKRLKIVQESQEKSQSTSKKTTRHSVPALKLSLAKALPRSKHGQILNLCSEVAKQFFEAKEYLKAIEALKICMTRIPEHTNADVLNMLLELLLLSERYSECLDVFTQFCGFQFDVTVGEDMSININSYAIPEDLHVDLKAKFIVCMIGLQSYSAVQNLIKEMMEKDDIEVCGMLFFDIAEALMSSGYYTEALDLLIPLVKSKNFSLAAIWLKHAECLTHLGLNNEAIEAYKNVIAMAPNHVDVLYPLAMLLLQEDRKQEALEVLSQDLSSGKLHVAVLIEQMKLLKQIGDLDNYWKCCELLLSRHCVVYKNYSELKIALLVKASMKDKLTRMGKIRMVKGEDWDLGLNLESIFEPSAEDEYKLYLEILQFAYEKQAYMQFQKFAFMGLCSKRFHKHSSEIFLISGYSCIFTKDYYHGYLIIKDLLLHDVDNLHAWNLCSLVATKFEEAIKTTRFFDAVSVKTRMPLAFTELVKANHYCVTAHYPQCLSYFLKDFRSNPSSYSAFMIGMVMLQQYCQKKVNSIQKKSMVEMVTYLFFNYAKIRSKHAQQEVYYNLGRMYQQIGVFYLAEHYYKMVFKVQNEYLDKYPEILDLKMEAAYNLHLIYKNSGNSAAARKILWQYCVI